MLKAKRNIHKKDITSKLAKLIKKANKDLKSGNISPIFTNSKEAVKWLGV